MLLGERRHLDGIVGDEGRLYVAALTLFAEDLVDELALAPGVVDLDMLLLAECAELLLGLSGDVEAGVLLDGVGHRHAAERSLE